MKVIAKTTENTFLVEMDVLELSSLTSLDRFDVTRYVTAGRELMVRRSFNTIQSFVDKADEAKQIGGNLRALASLLEGELIKACELIVEDKEPGQ